MIACSNLCRALLLCSPTNVFLLLGKRHLETSRNSSSRSHGKDETILDLGQDKVVSHYLVTCHSCIPCEL